MKPSASDKQLIEIAFRKNGSRRYESEQMVYKVLGDAAFKWNDVELWNRTAKSSQCWHSESDTKKWESIEKWGFAAVQSRYVLRKFRTAPYLTIRLWGYQASMVNSRVFMTTIFLD